MRKYLLHILALIITYLLFIYPIDVIIYLLYDNKLIKFPSILFTIVFYIVIIFNLKTFNNLPLIRSLLYTFVGIGFISFWILNLGLIINSLFIVSSIKIVIGCIVFIIILTVFSLINGRKIVSKKIDISSMKLKKNINLIFLSDIHLGSNSINHLKKIYLEIKNLNYDFILIGGDLIDSSLFNMENLKVFKKFKKPIFFITGNHEYYLRDYREKLNKLKEFNLISLENKSYKFKEINIVGISDNQKITDQIKNTNKLLKENIFNLLVVHKPTIWSSVCEKTDLMLSGHTHNGQIFPFNLFVKLQFKNIYGLYEKQFSKLYVSSGSGCWGPRMRLGTKNEIIQIYLKKT